MSAEVRPSGYETVFVTRAEMSDEALKALQDRVTGVISQFQGEVVLNEDWGKRKLAYPIRKESRGHYTYIAYQAKGEVVAEVERNLRLNEHVLRFLSVNLAKEFDAEAFKNVQLNAALNSNTKVATAATAAVVETATIAHAIANPHLLPKNKSNRS